MSDWQVRIKEERSVDGDRSWQLTLETRAGATTLARALLHERVGERLPRHWFHLGMVVHSASELGLFRRQPILLLGNDLTGSAELTALRRESDDPEVAPALVQAAITLLSLKSTQAQRHGEPAPGTRLIAELNGWRRADGQSPFWHGLGQHCLTLTPGQAERRFGPLWTRDLASLLPRQPVLVTLLADEAQAALSLPSADQLAWANALVQEGLHPGQHVTIFDGGPVHEGIVSALPLGRSCRWRTVRPGTPARPGLWWMTDGDAQILHRVPAALGSESVVVEPATFECLGGATMGPFWGAPASD